MFCALDLKSFSDWKEVANHLDVYYLPEYYRIYEEGREGKALLFYFQKPNARVVHPVLVRKIQGTDYYDMTSAYGYSGPLVIADSESEESGALNDYFRELENYAKKNHIVSGFVRFHPMLQNHRKMDQFYHVDYVSDTVFMETLSSEKLWGDIHKKKRNMIRKAEKNGVEIMEVDPLENVEVFYNIYISTMEKNGAGDYYFFSRSYFENTIKWLGDSVKMLVAKVEGEIVSASLFLLKKPFAHYHFSGTLPAGLKVAANDLLLYQMAESLVDQGYTRFHLGGGRSSNDDPLFRFKKRFSKTGRSGFYVGKKVYLPEVYQELVEEANIAPDENTSFFPLYRLG